MPCHLCPQGLDPCRTTLCQHRMQNVSLCIWSWTFSHLCLRQIIHDWVWPQAAGTDQSKELCWCTCKTTENAAMLAELWCKDHLQTWMRDVSSWYLITVCSSDCPRSSTRLGNPPRPYHTREEESFPTMHPRRSTTLLPGRDYNHRMAWRCHRPAKCTQTLSHPPRCSDCRRWTHPTGKSTHHSTTRKGESTCIDPWRTHGNLQVPVLSQCVYWPGINADIKRMVEACATCQWHRPQEPHQPLQPTWAPERPWQHLGADFMTFDGNEYLILVDYYSKMPIVRKMPTSQCNAAKTIATLKEIFGEHGILEIIHTDNGPQFSSHLFMEFT